MSNQPGKRETWGSTLGFVLAAAGSAVGLGNIWKFPYITGENGGGAFVLIYLICIATIGLPVMLCEIVLGRRTQRNPVGAFRILCPSSSTLAHLLGLALCIMGGLALLVRLSQFPDLLSEGVPFLQAISGWGWGVAFFLLGLAVFKWSWRLVGVMGVLAGFVILSFYSVVAGWTLGYTVNSASGRLRLEPEYQSTAVLTDVLLAEIQTPPEGLQDDLADQGLTDEEIAARLAQASRQQLVDYLAGPFAQADREALQALDDEALRERFSAAAGDMRRIKLEQMVTDAYGGMTVKQTKRGDERVYPDRLLTSFASQQFGQFITNPRLAVGFHLIFMLVTTGIVALGVQKGIETASKVLMPLLLLLLVVLIIRALTLEGAAAGVQFYLSPDFSKLSTESVLIALGHAFFSLSLGMGAMITYGSYVRKEQNLFLSTLSITALDTLIALMAGLAIFPAVFAHGFEPSQGAGLVFTVLPAVFHKMFMGSIWGGLFFLLLLVAALTSAISLLEVVTAYFVDERNWSRRLAAIVFGSVIFAVGAFCAISVADWSRLTWLDRALTWTFGTNDSSFFDLLDHLSSNWMLPLGGLFISLFVGWIWGTKRAVDEIRKGSHNFADVHLISLIAGLQDDHSHNSPVHVLTLASLWGIFIRFISPLAVMIAFLHTIGWIKTTPKPEPKPRQAQEQNVQQKSAQDVPQATPPVPPEQE